MDGAYFESPAPPLLAVFQIFPALLAVQPVVPENAKARKLRSVPVLLLLPEGQVAPLSEDRSSTAPLDTAATLLPPAEAMPYRW